MLYIDTSAFVPLFVNEHESDAVTRFLAAAPSGGAVSLWTMTEFMSALAMKTRLGAMTSADALMLRQRVESRIHLDFTVAPVLDADFTSAGALLVPEAAPLRAADALHLAICRRIGATLLTLDKQMQSAAQAHNIQVATI